MDRKLKILFVIRSAQIYHYYESIVSALERRGHPVIILFDQEWTGPEYISDVRHSFEWAHSRSDKWKKILFFSREVLSWRRYLLDKNQSEFYGDRWLKYISPKFRAFVKIFPPVKIFVKSKICGAFLEYIEKIAPPDKSILENIKKYNPDVVLATPVNFRQSSADLEYLKAAKFLGIPTGLPVISWDNLTTKGLMHIIPDAIFVWNESQKKEAMEGHDIPETNIKIVGAPFFDKWFTLLNAAPRQFREAKLFNRVNPYVLYLGSSDNIAPDERWLIKEIRDALDKSEDEKLKNTQIIFRPHPANYKVYRDFSLPKVFVQKEGDMPKDVKSLQDFYDLLFYSEAVTSINTSGMVDAIIAGRPVISFERDEFSATQVLAEHYRHMRESNALYITKTSEEFLAVFSKLLSGIDFKKPDREKFIGEFIRPCGLDKSAGEMVALEIEKLRSGYVEK